MDPLSRHTVCWNSLDYVDPAPGQLVSDLQLIANMFFPDPPNSDPFWMNSARSLFLGIALYLFSTPSRPRTIGEIRRQGMADDEEGFGHKWRRVFQGRMSGPQPLSEVYVRALMIMQTPAQLRQVSAPGSRRYLRLPEQSNPVIRLSSFLGPSQS